MNKSHIKEMISDFHKKDDALARRSKGCSAVRMLCIICCIYGIYLGYDKHMTEGYLFAFFTLIIFFFIVYKHRSVNEMRLDLAAYIEAYEDIEKRKDDRWKSFMDDGSDLLDDTMLQAKDLDILGMHSLFQYLSVAKTWEGRKTLAALLDWRKQDEQMILLRQKAVLECCKNETFTMHTIMLLKRLDHLGKRNKNHIEKMKQYFAEKKAFPRFLYLLSLLIPIWTISNLVLMAVFDRSASLALFGFMSSFILSLLFSIKTANACAGVEEISRSIKNYERILKKIQNESLETKYLKKLQESIKDAQKGIHQLTILSEMVHFRSNFIFFVLLNGLFLWDFHCVYALDKWKNTYGNQISQWFQAIGNLEAILSLVMLSYAKDQICVPEISQEDRFCFSQMYHPLLMEEKAVANDMILDNQTYIITGSNMSGKTTFLRTIGMNMILFHAGACICAKEASMYSMNLYTSMRVQDNISEGISTFYAEILRIKDMMSAAKKDEKMLVLIDEIFKGTNSADRILCAKRAIQCLHLPWIITMVSTHDFELCEMKLTDGKQVINYHFSEKYQDDQIYFDYHLKDGKCTTTNAKQLMRMAGLWEEL